MGGIRARAPGAAHGAESGTQGGPCKRERLVVESFPLLQLSLQSMTPAWVALHRPRESSESVALARAWVALHRPDEGQLPQRELLCTGPESLRSQLPWRVPGWHCTGLTKASCLGASASVVLLLRAGCSAPATRKSRSQLPRRTPGWRCTDPGGAVASARAVALRRCCCCWLLLAQVATSSNRRRSPRRCVVAWLRLVARPPPSRSQRECGPQKRGRRPSRP